MGSEKGHALPVSKFESSRGVGEEEVLFIVLSAVKDRLDSDPLAGGDIFHNLEFHPVFLGDDKVDFLSIGDQIMASFEEEVAVEFIKLI